jgi:hypothetical protein
VAVRLYGNDESLSSLLLLQSNVVLLSFIFQMGVRASIRLSVYSNKIILSKIFIKIFEALMLVIGLVGIVIEWLWGVSYYVTLSALVALTTVELSFVVARGKSKSIATWSSANFLATFYPGMIMLHSGSFLGYKYNANNLIEYIALIYLVFVFLFLTLGHIKKSFKRISSFIIFIIRSQSYQIGGANSVLMVFFLIQSSVSLLSNTDGMDVYADIQVVSGLFVLLLSKAMMLLEKKLYYGKINKLLVFSILLTVILLISIFSAVYALFYTETTWLIFFIAAFCLNSRIAWGAIVQYLDGARQYVNIISVLAILYYTYNYFFVDKVFWIWSVIGLVVLQLTLGVFLIIYYEKKSLRNKVTS